MKYNLTILFFLASLLGFSQTYNKVEQVDFNYTDLNTGATKSLVVHASPAPSETYCKDTTTKAWVLAKLDWGTHYTFGNKNVSAKVAFEVKGLDAYTGGNALFTKLDTMEIDSMTPDRLFLFAFTNQFEQTKKIDIKINNLWYSAPGEASTEVKDSLNFIVALEEEIHVDVTNEVITPQNPTIGNPTTFKWTKSGPCEVFGYEFQIVRLYNTDSAYAHDSIKTKAVLDWDQALRVQVEGGQDSLVLTLAQGTGFYAWRVRAVGNTFGGFGDSRDWSAWSNTYQSGTTLDITSTSAIPDSKIFWYEQFDQNKNFIFSRVFTEGNRISESMAYANALGNLRQSQSRLRSKNTLMVTQSLQDFAGRTALGTMAAPIDTGSLGYTDKFITVGGQLYTADNFDTDAKWNNPDAMDGGALHNYYSDNNADGTVASAEGYPFTRTLFYQDGTSRVKEQGGVGATHRLKNSGTTRTVKTLYGVASEKQLIAMFGDEAPADSSVQKVVTIDPNKVASVAFVDLSGKTIATCLAQSPQAATTMDTLPYTLTTLRDTLTQVSSQDSRHETTASKSLIVEVPKEFTFRYKLTAKEINSICSNNYCAECDYYVGLYLYNAYDNTTDTLGERLIGGSPCGSNTTYDTTITQVLQEGMYTLTKKVFTNNVRSGLETYMDHHMENVKDSIIAQSNDSLSSVHAFLDSADVVGLWDHFGVDVNVSNPDSVFDDSTVVVRFGCDSITLSIGVCDSSLYGASDPFDFEEYFENYWTDSAFSGKNNDTLLYFPKTNFDLQVKSGEFNTLTTNMVTDGYDKTKLVNIWKAITHSYVSMKEMADTTDGLEFDVLKTFLDETGRMYEGVSTTRTGSTGYIENAHKRFKYTIGNNTGCEKTVCWAKNGNDNDPNCFTNNPPSADNLTDSISKKYWEQLYYCIQPVDTFISPSLENQKGKVLSQCKDACNNRYAAFKTAIITAYHNDSIYVEGDTYKLKLNPDTIWGEVYSFSTDTLVQPFTNYKPIAGIECAAQNLVEHCMDKYCKITTTYDGSGNPDTLMTQEEYDNMEKAILSDFEVDFPSGGSCGAGWDLVTTKSDTINDGLGSMDTNVVKIWENSYGSSLPNETAVGTVELSDGYVVYGHTFSDNPYSSLDTNRGQIDFWLIKIDKFGGFQNSRLFGGDNRDVLTNVIKDSKENLILTGVSKTVTHGDKQSDTITAIDKWVVKIDKNFKILWETSLLEQPDSTSGTPTIHTEYPLKSAILEGDSILIVGRGITNGDIGVDLWTVSPDGNFSNRYFHVEDSIHRALDFVLTDSGEVFTVTKGTDQSGNIDYSLFKLDRSGNFGWKSSLDIGSSATNNFSSADLFIYKDHIYVASICKTGAGDFNSTNGLFDVYLSKYDLDGTREWHKNYGGSGDDARAWEFFPTISIDVDEEDRIILVTSSTSGISGDKTENSFGSYDLWYLELDTNGTLIHQKTYGGTNEDIATNINFINYKDGRHHMLITGYSDSPISGTKTSPLHGAYDMWVIGFRGYCSSDSICFRFVETDTVPDSVSIVLEPLTCEQLVADNIRQEINRQLSNIIVKHQDSIKASYWSTCAAPTGINDSLFITQQQAYYHFTLWYYDRAGNLVRTVPPKGVDVSSTSRMQHPSHTYVTEYNYNSLGQLESQKTPDGGETKFWYDGISMLRFSQNDQQKEDLTYSYTKYDPLRRIVEVGQGKDHLAALADSVDITEFPQTGTSQTTKTYYDATIATDIKFSVNHPKLGKQTHLQNRVAYVEGPDAHITAYSYDAHGNVKWLSQMDNIYFRSFLSYDYDLLNGNVQSAHYNDGWSDQFHHFYQYDDDGRLTDVYSGRFKNPLLDGKTTEAGRQEVMTDRLSTLSHEAHYDYYLHGPLNSTGLGNDKIQRLNNVYTNQMWLKAINHPSLASTDDPGNDGSSANGYAKDVWGTVLHYFDNDFVRTGTKYADNNSNFVSSTGITNPLFNGNIAAWTTNTNDGVQNAGLSGYQYRYDIINRIKKANYLNNGGSWSDVNDYDSEYSYDGNGNLLTLKRNGQASVNVDMDNFTYHYHNGKNQLDYVDDAIADGNYTTDLDDQASGNYRYDKIGNLTKDLKSNIDSIYWTAYGKVRAVKKSNGDSIHFRYDATGNRISKVVVTASGSDVTKYIRDASGNVVSIEERKPLGSNYAYYQTEVPLYGSDRVGTYRTFQKVIEVDGNDNRLTGGCLTCNDFHVVNKSFNQINLDKGYESEWTRELNHREYELKDHLGNVRALVHDMKDSTNKAIILAYNNPYPFGMNQPGRTYSGVQYRWGFIGKEIDPETGTSDHMYRTYNAKLGRYMSLDPLAKDFAWNSPYAYAENRVIDGIDLEGREYYKYEATKVEKDGKTVFDVEFKKKVVEDPFTALIQLGYKSEEQYDFRIYLKGESNGAYGVAYFNSVEELEAAAKMLESGSKTFSEVREMQVSKNFKKIKKAIVADAVLKVNGSLQSGVAKKIAANKPAVKTTGGSSAKSSNSSTAGGQKSATTGTGVKNSSKQLNSKVAKKANNQGNGVKKVDTGKKSKVKKSLSTTTVGGKYTKKVETRPGKGPGQSRAEYVRVKNKEGKVIRTYKDSYDRGNKFQGRKPLRGGPEGRKP